MFLVISRQSSTLIGVIGIWASWLSIGYCVGYGLSVWVSTISTSGRDDALNIKLRPYTMPSSVYPYGVGVSFWSSKGLGVNSQSQLEHFSVWSVPHLTSGISWLCSSEQWSSQLMLTALDCCFSMARRQLLAPVSTHYSHGKSKDSRNFVHSLPFIKFCKFSICTFKSLS